METSKRISKTSSVGDAAVEGLLNGIVAGVAMAVVVLAIEMLAGAAPLTVLGYFDVGSSASPLIGLFTHIAVSGIYGVAFGIGVMMLRRILGTRINLGGWIVLGAVYALVVLAIGEWIILPRTNSPLREVPIWAFGIAHVVYGVVLGWLSGRNI